ncbi:hypothetical protein B7494_g5243 [Chlorociboria aeruginascens]|nr:hypothetical protein B7494_g5243 [Chlorociboria aeruginascens]
MITEPAVASMPNWKSYESTVRLLSAVIAAHPDLKLNYDEIAKYFGDGLKYKGAWNRLSIINRNAEALRSAVHAGIDPYTIDINASPGIKSKGLDTSARFGGDCTKSALENRFRRIKSDAKLINDALKQGIDPITLAIGDAKGEDTKSGRGHDRIRPIAKQQLVMLGDGKDPKDIDLEYTSRNKGNEITSCFGSDATVGGVRFQFSTRIKNDANAIRAARAAGIDCKSLNLGGKATEGSSEMARHFGSDTSFGSLEKQFRQFRARAKLQQEAVKNGIDPMTLNLDVNAKGRAKAGSNFHLIFSTSLDSFPSYKDISISDPLPISFPVPGMSNYFGTDSTPGGIQFQFRAIKQDAQRQKAAFDAGTDPKDLVIGGGKDRHAQPKPMDAANGGAAPKVKTPRKPRAPKASSKKSSVQDDEDDEEGSVFEFGSAKKGPLNKTISGRVGKKQNRGKTVPMGTYIESDGEDDNGVKPENDEEFEDIDDYKFSQADDYGVYAGGNGGHQEHFYDMENEDAEA